MAAVEGVEVTSDSILKPLFSPSSPTHALTNTLVPLTAFDIANFNGHFGILYAFTPPQPNYTAMREGLAKALALFPHLAGRFVPDETGYPHLLLNDAGIRLKEANAPTTLEEHLPLNISSNLSNLHPDPAKSGELLLQIQLTRFSCGGFTLGLTRHHRACDGISMGHFFSAWARLARGLDVDVLPRFDRSALLAPRNPPGCEFDHLGVEFRRKATGKASNGIDVGASLSRMRELSVHFSKEFVAKLKDKVSDGDPTRRGSTFACVLTQTWKKVTLARGLADDEVTHVRLAVDGRRRLEPPFPAEYFGNLVLWAFPRLTAGELLRGSYSHVAQVIRDAVNRVDDGYLKSFIDFGVGSLGGENGEDIEGTLPDEGVFLNPHLECYSWLGLPFHELDFGGGEPRAVLPPWLKEEGLTILMPSCGEAGGVDVYLSLEKEHAAVFEKVCHSLD